MLGGWQRNRIVLPTPRAPRTVRCLLDLYEKPIVLSLVCVVPETAPEQEMTSQDIYMKWPVDMTGVGQDSGHLFLF